MENNSYASTAGGASASSGPSVPLVAETGEPLPESQLKPVHSNYVPAQVSGSMNILSNLRELKITFLQMEKHIEFLDFSSTGDLMLGTSSLVTRYWIGQLW